jgi:hypothetical protein
VAWQAFRPQRSGSRDESRAPGAEVSLVVQPRLRNARTLSSRAVAGHTFPARVATIGATYRQLCDFIRNEDGGPLVEFTLLVPMFILLMFGVIEWGNIFYVQSNMATAARMAARAVAVGTVTYSSTPATLTTAAIAVACGSGSPIKGAPLYTYTFTVTYDQGCLSGNLGSGFGNVSVNITTPAAPVSLLNYLGSIASTTLIQAQATMQQEQVCVDAGPLKNGSATSQTCP